MTCGPGPSGPRAVRAQVRSSYPPGSLMDNDRNLLFGALTVQADLVDDGQLTEACTAWSAGEAETLADVMVGRGLITPDDRAAVEQTLDRQLGGARRRPRRDARGDLAPPARRAPRVDGPDASPDAAATVPKTSQLDGRDAEHNRPRRPLGHQRQPDAAPTATPGPASTPPAGSAGSGWPRRQLRPRGRAEGDPPRARGERRRLVPLPRRGADHRPARAPRDRPGLRAGARRRGRVAVLHDAVRQGPDAHRGDPRLPQGPAPPGRRPRSTSSRCSTPSSASATRWRTPTRGG